MLYSVICHNCSTQYKIQFSTVIDSLAQEGFSSLFFVLVKQHKTTKYDKKPKNNFPDFYLLE